MNSEIRKPAFMLKMTLEEEKKRQITRNEEKEGGLGCGGKSDEVE